MDAVKYSTNECISDSSIQWENLFLSSLNEILTYEITSDILTLTSANSYELKFRFKSSNEIINPTCLDFENNYSDVSLFRNWILLGYIDEEKHCKPESVREISLEFVTNDSIHGYGSMNEFYGNIALNEPDSINVTNLLSTAVYNSNDTIVFWEDVYTKAITKSGTYDIQGIKLILRKDKVSYIFKADGY